VVPTPGSCRCAAALRRSWRAMAGEGDPGNRQGGPRAPRSMTCCRNGCFTLRGEKVTWRTWSRTTRARDWPRGATGATARSGYANLWDRAPGSSEPLEDPCDPDSGGEGLCLRHQVDVATRCGRRLRSPEGRTRIHRGIARADEHEARPTGDATMTKVTPTADDRPTTHRSQSDSLDAA